MFASLVKHVDSGGTVIFLFEKLEELSSFDFVLQGC